MVLTVKETWSVPAILILTTLVAVSGSYVFGSAVGYSSPAQTGIMDDLNLGVAKYSLFGSILTIGAMIGAIISGRIADYAGRRTAMGFSEVFCILGWLVIAFSKVGWWLYIGRLLVGYGMGLLSYVVPVYIAEITPKNLRGGFTTVHQVAGELSMAAVEALQKETEASIIGLFQLQYLKSLTVGVGLMILQQFGGVNDIAFCASSIFISAGFSGSIGMIAMVAVQIPMTALGVLLMDKSGRRPLLLVKSSLRRENGCFLAALSFTLQDLHKWKEGSSILTLVGVLAYTGSFLLGMGGIPLVIMSEIFPINVKGSAGSLVNLASWLCSWIVSYAFNFLMSWSSAGRFTFTLNSL
ncbi:hypothetical protein JHK87_054450 [Glycine soja]|nr:hypothetical protein JHK87_054450 [Glycine soja]